MWWNKSKCIQFLMIFTITINVQQYFINLPTVMAQRTQLDVIFRDLYRPLRLIGLQFAGRSGEDVRNVRRVENMGKTQKSSLRGRSLVQLCDAQNGPGRRSDKRPTSIHRLRPGDIDIIAGMGDSLTAGNGIFASTLLHITVENRGVSWSIGGKANWRKYLTLPNILKEFNSNLYGYSIEDGLATDRNSKFNVAELGAMSRDIPYQATILVKRLQRDPRVNMTHDWKLATLLIGNNDFCTDICYHRNPEDTIKYHEEDMVKTYRYLRDNVPRLMLNVVPSPNLRLLTRLVGLPKHCQTTLRFECPCLYGKNKQHLDYYDRIIKLWIANDYEVAGRNEFNTEEFTINVQPFTQFSDLPKTADGNTDLRLISQDCFHLSQIGQAISANALWNNMMQAPDNKTLLNPNLLEKFLCPTDKEPYIKTRINSDSNFQP